MFADSRARVIAVSVGVLGAAILIMWRLEVIIDKGWDGPANQAQSLARTNRLRSALKGEVVASSSELRTGVLSIVSMNDLRCMSFEVTDQSRFGADLLKGGEGCGWLREVQWQFADGDDGKIIMRSSDSPQTTLWYLDREVMESSEKELRVVVDEQSEGRKAIFLYRKPSSQYPIGRLLVVIVCDESFLLVEGVIGNSFDEALVSRAVNDVASRFLTMWRSGITK